MIDFEEAKQKQKRGTTVKELIESALKHSDETESIIIVSKQKDGTVLTGFSWESSLESLGMLEIGKQTVMNEMRE